MAVLKRDGCDDEGGEECIPWELLYADNLVSMATTREELRRKLMGVEQVC